MPHLTFRLRQWTNRLVFLLLLLVTALALVHPIVSNDSNWYHFPFSRILCHIGHATTNDLTGVILERWNGFPKFAETMQGLVWRVTGCRSLVTLPHILLFFIYLWMIRRCLRLPLLLLVLALFACPMILLHYVDTYIDLLGGLGLALAAFGAMRTLWYLRQPGPLPNNYDWLIASSALVMAANAKYQTLLAALVLLGLLFIQIVFSRRIVPRRKTLAVAWIGLLALACTIVPITNTARYHNPFYPITVSWHAHVLFPGPEAMDTLSPGYPASILNLPPVTFLLSATEIDWSLRGVPTAYSIDSSLGDHPAHFKPARTGGWGGVYMLLVSVVLILGVCRYRALGDTLLRTCLVNFLVLTLLTSFLPQSFMLRYYLYVPLLLIPVALKLCLRNRASLNCVKIVLVVLLVFYLSCFHPGTGLRQPAAAGTTAAYNPPTPVKDSASPCGCGVVHG